MKIKASITPTQLIMMLLVLCLPLAVSSCAQAQFPAENDVEHEMETIELYDLTFSIPEQLEIFDLIGDEKSVYASFERNEDGNDISWMSISLKRQSLATSADSPVAMDSSGTPILTKEFVSDQFDWETEVQKVYREGTLDVGGKPGAYIEVKLYSETFPDEIWRVRLTRVVFNGIAYNFLYASSPKQFNKYSATANNIISSAKFKPENQTAKTTFWGITLNYPSDGVDATISKEQVFLRDDRRRGNAPLFYAKHDDSVLYTDELLDNKPQVDRLLRIWSYNLVNQNFRNYREPQEILREMTQINGKRALRAVFHDTWEYNPYDEYMEILLFVHNNDLYILQGKGEVGHEDVLSSFMQPIINSVNFEAETEPPAERPLPYSDTVKWMNDTYAILTIHNGADTDLLGGYLPIQINAQALQEGLLANWGISDRESSDEVIRSLYQNGHRARFRNFIEESGIFRLEWKMFQWKLKENPLELQKMRYIYENTHESYLLYGDDAILAWDYCRIIYLYHSGYIAGFYTYSEALELSLPIALELQQIYSSWGEMYRDYMAGFHFWSPGDVNDPSTQNYSRTQIMLHLEASPNALPWETKLVADWRPTAPL